MKSRAIIIGICLAFCVAAIARVIVRERRLEDLRARALQVQSELQKLNSIPAPPEIQPVETNRAGIHASASPSPELLRLRNQVSLLGRRQRELAAVPAENERLRARIAGARTNATTALPPGYIRKSEARFVGYAKPEDTIQSMLSAIQHRDLTNFVASFTPEAARELQKAMEAVEQSGKTIEQFFQAADEFVGLRVISSNAKTEDLIELQIQDVPGQDTQTNPHTVRFRRINGDWKMDSP